MFRLLIALAHADGERGIHATTAHSLDRGEVIVELMAPSPALLGARVGLTDHLEIWGGGGAMLEYGGADGVAGAGVRASAALGERLHLAMGLGAFNHELNPSPSRIAIPGARAAVSWGPPGRYHLTASMMVLRYGPGWLPIRPMVAAAVPVSGRWDVGVEASWPRGRRWGYPEVVVWGRRQLGEGPWSLALGLPVEVSPEPSLWVPTLSLRWNLR